jgi:hypothetical protein
MALAQLHIGEAPHNSGSDGHFDRRILENREVDSIAGLDCRE